jgi:hypothetical protein
MPRRVRHGAIARAGYKTITWSPAALSPLGWWDASAAATITEVSSAVSQWDDRSGGGRHLTQGTSGNRPVKSTFAGRPSILFDGSNDTLARSSFSVNSTSMTMWVLGVILTGATAAKRLMSFSTGTDYIGTAGGTLTTSNGSATKFAIHRNSAEIIPTGDYSHNVLSAKLAKFDGTNASIYVNNVLASGPAASTGTFSSNGKLLLSGGDLASSPSFWLKCHVMEAILLKTSISDADRKKLHAYAQAKWRF